MKRRHYLQALVGMSAVGLSGCQRLQLSETKTTERKNKVLNIFPKIRKISDDWSMKARVINVYDWHTSFQEVQLLAFAANGTKVCEAAVGDLNGHKKTVETTCSEFPAITTATARETPCEDALIPINYWVGTDAQRTETVDNEEVLWKDTYRKCGEDLPPKRVLEKFDRASED